MREGHSFQLLDLLLKLLDITQGGEGARRFGGRCNQKRTPMVCCAGSLSLACLEALVHLEVQDWPRDYHAMGIVIPKTVSSRKRDPTDLTPHWQTIPGPEALKLDSTAWAKAGTEALLVVPSAIISMEYNYLINSDHPDVSND